MDLDNELSKFTDHDDKMFRFTQTHGTNLLFIICGKAVALQNLLLFAGKTLRRENLNSAEATITGKLDDGSLLNDLEFYVKSSGNVSNDKNLPALRAAINALKTKSMVDAAVFLKFYINPQNYYCPFINDTSSPEKIIEASKGLNNSSRLIQDWNKLNDKYILLLYVVSDLKSSRTSHSTFNKLEQMAADG